MADPAEIARRLTKAQKRALLWLPEDGSATNGTKLPLGLQNRHLKALAEIGLCGIGGGWGWHATALGTQVRAVVEQGGGA